MKNKIMIALLLMGLTGLAYGGTRVETQDTVFSNAQVRIYGTNESTDLLGYGGNGLEIDGSTGVDKNLLFLDNGTKTFTWMIYRGEAGKYFYLHDYEAEKQPLVVSRSGRFGVNKMNNLLNYHTLTSDSEHSSDMEVDDTKTVYTPNYQLMYLMTIVSSTVTQDFYTIATSRDNITFTTNTATGDGGTNAIYLASTNIGNGVWIKWLSVSGTVENVHTVGATRKFLGIPQLPRASLSVSPMFIDEVMINTNRNGTAGWVDRTYEANSSEYGTFRPFRAGTNSMMYIGMTIPNNTFYLNIVTGAVGALVTREYWAGGSWKTVSNVVDSTLNLTVSGEVSFDTTQMSDWAKTNLTVDTYTDKYYWYRSYSTNVITTEPVVECITRHGSKRMQVYTAPLDDTPAMFVDSGGNTWIGGLPLTPATVQTFYYKFLATCSTQTVAPTASTITPFATEVRDVYNVYTNAQWYPNTTNMVRMNWSIRTAAPLAAARGFYVVLFQNGAAIRDIGVSVSGDNADLPINNSTYIFAPPSTTNYYQLGLRRFSGNDVTMAGGNTNWWFGEKIQ